MVDIIRTDAQILALMPDNNVGAIEPQDVRDSFVSLRDRDYFKPGQTAPVAGAVTINAMRAQHWWIDMTANVTSFTINGIYFINLAWPQDVTNARFSKGSATTITANAGQDPQGFNTATRIVMPSVGSTFVDAPWAAWSGRPYTMGLYVKENGVGSLFSLNVRDSGAQVQSTNFTPTSSWQLYQISYTPASTQTHFFELDNRNPQVALDLLVWGWQIYYGTTLPGYDGSVTTDASGPNGNITTVRLYIKQDGTGGRTFSWPSWLKWEGAVAPVLSTAANAIDIVDLYFPDGGAHAIGTLVCKGAA